MKRYIYVEARQVPAGEGGRISFAHTFVAAGDEGRAYARGPALLREDVADGLVQDHSMAWPFVNDYVIEVP